MVSKTFFLAKLVLLGLVTLQVSKAYSAAEKCQVIFSESEPVEVSRVIRNLAELRMNLDLAKVQSATTPELTALSFEYAKKEREIIAELEAGKIMSRAELAERIKQEIISSQSARRTEEQEQVRRREVQNKEIQKNKIDGRRAVFHRLEPGTFTMGTKNMKNQVEVTILRPFEMAATLTTQIIWRKVVDLANTQLGGKYQIDPKPSEYRGATRPVENMSRDEIQTWFKALNELSQMGEPALKNFIRGHKTGDVYRLPTNVEWEFVVRSRGRLNEQYYFVKDEASLGDFAWYSENSERKTHPVATKRPLVFDSKEFYDLLGNVKEWMLDKEMIDGEFYFVIRGGSYDTASFSMEARFDSSLSHTGIGLGSDGQEKGFRMVREVRD